MDSIKTIKFKQIATCIRSVMLLSLIGLLFKVFPELNNEISLPTTIDFLRPYISEIMFSVAMLIFTLAIYFFNSIVMTLLRYLLIIMPFTMLARSFYLSEGYLFSANLFIVSLITLFSLLVQIYRNFKSTKIFDYLEELLLFLFLFIPGMLIVLSQMEILDWIHGKSLVFESIVMLLGAMFSLILILINLYGKNTNSRMIVSIIISILSGFIFYRFFKIGSYGVSLHYAFITVWTLVVAIYRERDFKLNG